MNLRYVRVEHQLMVLHNQQASQQVWQQLLGKVSGRKVFEVLSLQHSDQDQVQVQGAPDILRQESLDLQRLYVENQKFSYRLKITHLYKTRIYHNF